jgi:hypothetical protein
VTRTLIGALLVAVALPCAAQPSPPKIGANTKFCREIAAQTETAHAIWDDGYDPNVMIGIYDRTYLACITDEALKRRWTYPA